MHDVANDLQPVEPKSRAHWVGNVIALLSVLFWLLVGICSAQVNRSISLLVFPLIFGCISIFNFLLISSLFKNAIASAAIVVVINAALFHSYPG